MDGDQRKPSAEVGVTTLEGQVRVNGNRMKPRLTELHDSILSGDGTFVRAGRDTLLRWGVVGSKFGGAQQ